MKQVISFGIILLTIGLFSCNNSKFKYPETKKVNQVDEYFGVKVEDPYRWLEDDRSEETNQWVMAQNKVTSDYLAQIPFREKIKNRLTELYRIETMRSPVKNGDKYFYLKNDGLQNQPILYMQASLNDEPIVLIDPNNLSEDGTVAIDENFKISKNGKYIAYQISQAGSDWHKILVRDIETGEDLEDNIEWVKFSEIAWFKDGFFYSRYPASEEGKEYSGKNKNHKVCYHKLGTKPEEDQVIFESRENPFRNYRAGVSSDEKYLFVYEQESSSGNNLYVKNLKKNDGFVKLTTGFNYEYKVLDQLGDNLMVLTNYQAPKYKLVRINVNSLNIGNWVDVLPEKKEVLKECALAGDKIIASYMVDVKTKMEVYDVKGKYLNDIELPTLGTVSDIASSVKCNEVFYTFKSFTVPPTIYKYNIEANTSEVYFKPELDFDDSQYETKQIFYKAKDGIRIPMFIVHKKGLELNGENPTLLYAYGGFNISKTPDFKFDKLFWLENNGVFALANIRGGGEYGENWHKAGMRLNKQNVFDDFIAASEYLINEQYTSPERLSIEGGSNGGLLVGAVVNQRPDLYQVAIPKVGVMDMLRYQKFTIGWAWINEYGASEDSIQFFNLYNYSPLHNISKDADYPAVMVMTADHDDRVVPAHSFKYIATLQENYKGKNPTLIRIQTNTGHGLGKPISVRINEAADKWSFAFKNMGVVPVLGD